MTTMTKRSQREAAALSRRNAEQVARKAAHAAMMAQHAARKAEKQAAIALWENAWDLWIAADCKGPRPIHPDGVSATPRPFVTA